MATEPLRWIVIDPGERVGWCAFTETGGVIDQETFRVAVHPLKQFAEALIGKTIVPAACDGLVELDVIAYEKWALYASHAKALIGSEMLSSQLVGIIRSCAWVSGAKLRQLPANKKGTGLTVMPAWLQAKRSHCSEEHSKDAIDLASYVLYRTYVLTKFNKKAA